MLIYFVLSAMMGSVAASTNAVGERGLFSTIGATTSPASKSTSSLVPTTTNTAIPGESALAACGQTCFNNMLAQYSTLGCSALDSFCLCSNVDFSNGLRDCSNGACGTDVAAASSAIAFGSAYCSTATATHTAVTSTAIPGESALAACGQTCFNNMLAQYSTLGCTALDGYCLCSNVDFSNGLRDCSNGACGTDVAAASSAIAFGSAYCSSATATHAATSTVILTTSTAKSSTTTSPTTLTTVTSTSSKSTSTSSKGTTTSSVSSSSAVSGSPTTTQPPWTSVETNPLLYNMAITTTFTQPAQCSGEAISQMAFWGTNLWENAINPVPTSTVTTCYPSQFYSSVIGALSSVVLPAFSQLVCPQDWQMITYNATYGVCCPNGFAVNAPNYLSSTDRPFSEAACTSWFGPQEEYDVTSYDSSAYLTVVAATAPTDGTVVYVNAFDGIIATAPFTATSISTSSVASCTAAPTIAVTFRVPYDVNSTSAAAGEYIALVGSTDELSAWNTTESIEMTESFDTWSTTVNLLAGEYVEYKFLHYEVDGTFEWSDDPNYSLTVPSGACISKTTVSNTWASTAAAASATATPTSSVSATTT